MKLSERQQMLDLLWRYYRCANYDGRKYDWDGSPSMGKIEHDVVSTSGNWSNGFGDNGATEDIPLKFRKPTAPFYLGRVIVRRFTSLLFSQKRHPRINADDPETEDWLNGFAEATRLWSQMAKARNYGGAMGSVALGFKIVDSKPIVEIHDPRWCHPDFIDRDTLEVRSLEKRYQFPEEVLNERGERVEQWFWYRRVIDAESDTVWPKVPVYDDQEPEWDRENSSAVEHGLGFCPIVWVQNIDVDDSVDGDPDCLGTYDTIEEVDRLWAQAARGTKANCDPSLVISSDAKFSNIQKGSNRAIQTEKGGDAHYMEISGAGITIAMDLAKALEDRVAMISRCELKTNFDGPARTEEEVEKNYSNMIEQADELREQFGERGVKKLLEMVLLCARVVTQSAIDYDSNPEYPVMTKSAIKLPKKSVTDPDTGEVTWEERVLGSGSQIELSWPQYFTPSLESVAKSVEAAGQANQYGLITKKTAAKYVADHFQVEDSRKEAEEATAEADAAMAASAQLMSGPVMDPAAGAAAAKAEKKPGAASKASKTAMFS
jgi:hypothetical protein